MAFPRNSKGEFIHYRGHYENQILEEKCINMSSYSYSSLYCRTLSFRRTRFLFAIRGHVIEKLIIDEVKKEIGKHIRIISPTKYVFIALDGVAEQAKKKQQKERRMKKKIRDKLDGVEKLWDTTEITAGTLFMSKLSESIYEHFRPEDFGVNELICRVAMNRARENINLQYKKEEI